jgi:hypothetical protein
MAGIIKQIVAKITVSKSKGKAFDKEMAEALSQEAIANKTDCKK